MTQIGESVTEIPSDGKELCCFCGEEHQAQKAAAVCDFARGAMDIFKKEGREYSIANYSSRYPGVHKAPLAEWKSDIKETGGYKAAAHHCVAYESINQHAISGELKAAGYDPNRGSNCAWLPYNSLQFSRARAYGKALQKHSGGHTGAYFKKVRKHIDQVAAFIKYNFCNENRQAGRQDLLEYMLMQESNIWRAVTGVKFESYRLHNDAYLDPFAPWDSFPNETGKTKLQLINDGAILADDLAAEKLNESDPEKL